MTEAAAPQIVALALDQSPTATGWAIGRPNGPAPAFGTYRLPPWGNDEGARLVSYERFLVKQITDYRVTNIYYEAPYIASHNDIHAIQPQFFVIALINLVGARLGVDVAQVRIDDWRKWTYGFCKIPAMKGDAARKEWKRMAKVVCAKADLYCETDDEAEACLILDYGLSDADHKHRRNSGIRQRRAELSHWMGDRR